MISDTVMALETKFSRLARQQHLVPETIWETGPDAIRVWTRDSDSGNALRIFISAGIHGDEPCGPEALLQFLETHELSRACHWAIAPILNPWGLKNGKRENASGIDLNRDFLQKQSEEIRAITQWWENQNQGCDLHLSLHEDWETDGLYLYEINTGKLLPLGERILHNLPDFIPRQIKGPVDGHDLSAPGLILHEPEPDEAFGWPEAIWLAKRSPILSITLEAPGQISRHERTACLLASLTAAVSEAESIPRSD